MRLEVPRYMERYGAVRIYDVQRVLELTGGRSSGPRGDLLGVINVGRYELEELESDMVIIVPVKNENPKVLTGVLSGIPHEAHVVIVSNSMRNTIDRYRVEMDVVFQFYRLTKRPIVMVHQKDPVWSDALPEAGYPHLLGEDGLVKNGKGEGMILGLLIAKALGKKYVGFIDSDNYVPASVNEYVDIYAAGFYMAKSQYTMVRIKWPYKTKFLSKGFYFRRRGRVSEITNKYLNLLLARITHFEPDIIKTGNAGEHAMTMELAKRLAYAGGYSIEPYELVHIFEEYTGIKKPRFPDIMKHTLEIYQVEPRSPHIHEERGGGHIAGMLLSSLSVIYHSILADEDLRERIVDELRARKALPKDGEIPRPTVYPPIYSADSRKLVKTLEEASEDFIRTD